MPMPIKVIPADIPGVLLIETGCANDERGFFSEVYSEAVWTSAGLRERFVQDNLSLSKRGTLRGLHYQIEPHGMGKLVRVVRGAVYDVGVDLRKGSPTFGKWYGKELNDENKLAIWFPAGFAHGFMALEDDTFVYYKCDAHHMPEAERTIRFDDPQVAIAWPMKPFFISKKDAQAPTFSEAEHNFEYRS